MEKSFSDVWKHFKKKDTNNEAQCSHCPKILSCKGSSTSGLLRHLELIHKIKIHKISPVDAEAEPSTSTSSSSPQVDLTGTTGTPAKRQKIEQSDINFFFQKPIKLSEKVARLAAEDGITIRAIVRSDFIRQSFKLQKCTLPKSETKVMQLIIECYEEKKNEVISQLQSLIEADKRLSATLDEWTSLKNRRYLNINLHTHDGKLFNLGLVFISGSCGAFQMKELVTKRLSEFNLHFEKHIVATTTDGAAMMQKFARESPSEMMLCINHAVHLAVVDVLYSKKNVAEGTDDSDDDDNTDLDQEDDNFEDEYDTDFEGETENVEISEPDIKKAINETRNIVRLFRKSPLKNGILQEYVKQEHGKELQLSLDVKTRWNSLVVMIQSFLKIKASIKKALIDIKVPWNEDNEAVLENLTGLLNPVKLAVEALSRQDATMLTCDAIITVLLKNIRKMKTPLSEQLADALQRRIEQRRSVDLFSLCQYLQNPENLASLSSNLQSSEKQKLISYAEVLFCRLFPERSSNSSPKSFSDSEDDRTLKDLRETPFEIQLSEAIQNVNKVFTTTSRITTPLKLKKEFQLYETTRKRTPNLEMLYQALLSVKPTSTDSERVFSVAGGFVTKVRNRLSDRSLNALTFLKAHFTKK